MNEERIQEVFSDEAFVAELINKETPEEVQALLAEKDIDVTIDDVVKMKEMVLKQAAQAESDGELGDDDLEDVAGGILPVAVSILIGVMCVASLVAPIARGVSEQTRNRW